MEHIYHITVTQKDKDNENKLVTTTTEIVGDDEFVEFRNSLFPKQVLWLNDVRLTHTTDYGLDVTHLVLTEVDAVVTIISMLRATERELEEEKEYEKNELALD
jgi:hypothetical protein